MLLNATREGRSQHLFSFCTTQCTSFQSHQVAEVAAWVNASGKDVDWSIADSDGVTPLHLAACLQVSLVK